MVKANTRFGELEFSKDGDKYIVALPTESTITQTMNKFKPETWLTLVEKCKEAGMEADSIITTTNKEGNNVVLSSKDTKDVVIFLDYIGELAGINSPSAKPQKPQAEHVQLEADVISDANKKLGFS